MERGNRRARVLLIDDDADFAALVAEHADGAGVDFVWHESLVELGHMALLGKFDLAILDYQLRDMTGLDIASYVDVFFADLPVLLISASSSFGEEKRVWPRCIKGFLKKSEEGRNALATAMAGVQRGREH